MTGGQSVERSRQTHAPAIASVLTLVAMVIWTAHDVFIKLLTAGYSIPQIVFFSRILAVPLGLYLMIGKSGFLGVHPSRVGQHLFRAALSIIDMLCFASALALTSIANTITINFAAPLIMTILSVLFLRERAGWRRWLAVIVGFVGVVVVLQPSAAGFSAASFFALGSAVAYAVFLTLTRAMTAHEPVSTMIVWNSSVVMIVMAILMMPDWQTPSSRDWVWFGLLAATGAAGQFLSTEAFRLGEASFLAPLQYTALIWATLFGYLVFADFPTPTLWLGAAIIFCATLYLVQHEHRHGKA